MTSPTHAELTDLAAQLRHSGMPEVAGHPYWMEWIATTMHQERQVQGEARLFPFGPIRIHGGGIPYLETSAELMSISFGDTKWQVQPARLRGGMFELLELPTSRITIVRFTLVRETTQRMYYLDVPPGATAQRTGTCACGAPAIGRNLHRQPACAEWPDCVSD